MSSKHTKATPAGIPRSRSRYTRRVRTIIEREFRKIMNIHEYEDDLADMYLEAALRCMENPSCFVHTEPSTTEQTDR